MHLTFDEKYNITCLSATYLFSKLVGKRFLPIDGLQNDSTLPYKKHPKGMKYVIIMNNIHFPCL